MDEGKFEVIANSIPPGSRYRAILRRVLERLPAGWDEFRSFGVWLEYGPSGGYASAYRFDAVETDGEEDEAGSHHGWLVTLFPYRLDRFSDEAVSWVLAHELAHVASSCPCGRTIYGRRVLRDWETHRKLSDVEIAIHEERADAIALEWGFGREAAALKREESCGVN